MPVDQTIEKMTQPGLTRGGSNRKSAPRSIVVVGADGFVGGGLAKGLSTTKITYGQPRDDEIHISQAAPLLRNADVIINTGGFRIQPGCGYADYQRSHEGATAAIIAHIRPGALLIQISSASVLGKSTTRSLGPRATPAPETFPSPSYAMAKFEADRFLVRAAAERDFRVVFLRPATVYSKDGAGIIGTLIKLAKRGIILRLYPHEARQHFCCMRLLVDVVGRVIEHDVPHLTGLLVADPYAITNRELEAIIRLYTPTSKLVLPIPANWLSTLLTRTVRSKNPKLDLRTWGEIFGVLNLDTVYDPTETYTLLGIDPAQYSLERTLQPVIKEAVRPESL
ncbi:MAG: NAD-dependent epimerase/dehydratase family protein [Verrucomicrobiota bacterium]